jgi:hypothetical protein
VKSICTPTYIFYIRVILTGLTQLVEVLPHYIYTLSRILEAIWHASSTHHVPVVYHIAIFILVFLNVGTFPDPRQSQTKRCDSRVIFRFWTGLPSLTRIEQSYRFFGLARVIGSVLARARKQKKNLGEKPWGCMPCVPVNQDRCSISLWKS